MAIRCPRCLTDVPDEALYCSYCNLPKPRSEPPVTAKDSAEYCSPNQAPRTQTAFNDTRGGERLRKSTAAGSRLPLFGLAGVIALFVVGIYIYVVPLVHSEEAEPKSVLAALDKLRHSPSNEPDITIDARLMRELERLRRSGNLGGYQGWVVQPVKGTTTRVLLVFSYQEIGNVQHRAEWLADLSNNTFTPQNELAVSISR